MTLAKDMQGGAAPITSQERLGELDVLRGFALLGVLIANFVWFAFGETTATDAQRQTWMSFELNRYAILFTEVFVNDKANTLFAFLFGMGFWIQMDRLKARGGAFERIYLRRLTILLLFGAAHMILLWPWDILQQYALVGFLLFALRGLSLRTMLLAGIVLAVAARPLFKYVFEIAGISTATDKIMFSETAILHRQAVFAGDSYSAWVQETLRLAHYDYLASGLIVAWSFYVLGRFFLGAYVARKRWLQRAGELLPAMRRIFLIALPLGLLAEGTQTAMHNDFLQGPEFVKEALHAVGVPILALGYATGLILLFHSSRWHWLAALFAPVGRMALTNYVLQGVMMFLLLYGIGPGLALAGRIAPAETLSISLIFFALQIAFSHWWLKRYRFGPLEWAWRALTYGERPAFRQRGP